MSEQQSPFQPRPDGKPTDECGAEQATATPAKSSFFEPEISAPVDVLEATTFFQAATSGGTN